jgi:sporulation related protein
VNRTRVSGAPRPLRGRRNARGGTLLGIFVGLVLGLAIAAAVAYYLGRGGFTSPIPLTPAPKDGLRTGKAETAAPDKPRFDFYKILPGAEEPKVTPERKSVDKATVDAVAKAPESSPAKAADRAWLQAGAFTNQSDAENLKARLALSGWEAVVQSATLPDKSVRYRVRLGPFDNSNELNRIKNDLGKGGFEVAVIKNQQ